MPAAVVLDIATKLIYRVLSWTCSFAPACLVGKLNETGLKDLFVLNLPSATIDDEFLVLSKPI